MAAIKIINKTTKSTISESALHCPHFWQKGSGLMFSKQKDLIFEEKNERIVPLHMFFVFYPIDVIFLNENKEVIELKKSFMPFTFYCPINKAKYIIECKAGTIESTKTILTDVLEFQ
jgi:uncharacterized protein